MTKIKLAQKPNMIVPVATERFNFIFHVRQFRGQVFVSIQNDGEYIVASRRAVVNENLFPGGLSSRYGSLYFRSKYDDVITDYKKYNSSVYLEYQPPKG